MNRILALLLAGLAIAVTGCTHETVVYRTHRTYYRQPVYVEREQRSPATVAGQATQLTNPGEPATFRAESGN